MSSKVARRRYKPSDFAKLSGVSVRTLHHYDAIGLLPPSDHTESGYRLYREQDFARLQQIATLKFIGFSLKEIGELMNGEGYDLVRILDLQRQDLVAKMQTLRDAIKAIESCQEEATKHSPDWLTFSRVTEILAMEQNRNWSRKYYSEEANGKIDNHPLKDQAEEGQKDWQELIASVESSLHLDPSCSEAQELARRWNALIQAFTMDDPEIEGGLKRLWSDEQNWPKTFKKPYSDAAGAWIEKAMAILKSRHP